MVEIELSYLGDLRVSATHSSSRTTLLTDAPVDNQGKGESFSPTDLVATATGACMATILGIKARDKGLDLSGTRIRVEKHMSTDTPRRIARLVIALRIPLSPDHPARPVLEAAALACPVHKSLHPDIIQDITWHWEAPAA